MKKLIAKNLYTLSVALIICNAMAMVVDVLGLMPLVLPLICAIFTLVSLKVIRSAYDLYHESFKLTYISGIVLLISSIGTIFLNLYYDYKDISDLFVVTLIAMWLCWCSRIFVLLTFGIAMNQYLEKEGHAEFTSRLRVYKILTIVCAAFDSMKIMDAFGLGNEFVMIAKTLSYISYIVLFIVAAEIMARVKALETGEPEEDYGYKARAITATVVVALIMIVQTVLRCTFAHSIFNSTLKYASEPVIKSELKADENGYGLVGRLPGDDWETVSTLDGILAYEENEKEFVFVIEVDRSQIEEVSGAETVGISIGATLGRCRMIFGDSIILENLIWKCRDYVITLNDGNKIYATYPEELMKRLGDGEIKLPIADAYCPNELDALDGYFYNAFHVVSFEDRPETIDYVHVRGSYIDWLTFGDCVYDMAGKYYGIVLIMLIVSIIVSGRFMYKGLKNY